ncbi:MAG: hypothetical protein ABEH38_06245 [Flavobacteriales bacterium]
MDKAKRTIRRKNAPLAFYWEKVRDLIFGKGRDPWEGKRPIFIVSTGRTATKFFAKFFRERFDKVRAVHEPPIDIFPVAVAYFRGKLSYEKARFYFDYFRNWILKEMDERGERIYLESNPRLAFMLPIVKNLGKDHRIIHITRDCKAYVRSGYSKETEIQGKTVKVRSKADPRNRITAKDFPKDPYTRKWDKMSRFEKNCWFWQKKDRLIQEELAEDPNSCRFYYEQLFESQKAEEVWEELIRFIGLKDHEQDAGRIRDYLSSNVENKNAYYELGPWDTWTEEQQRTLIEIAGEHMKELGYEL